MPTSLTPLQAIEQLTVIAHNLDMVKEINISGPALYTIQQHFTPKPPRFHHAHYQYCEACKTDIMNDFAPKNYCPNCGQRWF